MSDESSKPSDIEHKNAFRFVIFIGIVSLFADMTYEGARSINGQFLESLNASGTVVGVVAGLGELIGYSIRLFSGYQTDKKGYYWTLSFIGYFINLLAVPLLALAGNWPLAAFLMVSERFGKGIRNPPRDAMLSHAGSVVGTGFTFGLHEAMDQIGAILGPLIVVVIYARKGSYKTGYAVLLIPALLALTVLTLARFQYPNPRDLEKKNLSIQGGGELPRIFWIYILAIGFIAMGFADFPLIGYHLSHKAVVSDKWIPLLYSLAMGVDAIAALVFGSLFDKMGIKILAYSVIISAFFAPLVFLFGSTEAVLGMVLWGLGMGAHESIMSAVIADIIPVDRRGSAYGIYNVFYGLFWFTGSAIMGVFLDYSLIALVIFSVVAELMSIPFLMRVMRQQAVAT